MKVNDFMKKIIAGRLNVPVFLQEGISGEPRKARGQDFFNGHYAEKDRTICSIELRTDKVVVYYK